MNADSHMSPVTHMVLRIMAVGVIILLLLTEK